MTQKTRPRAVPSNMSVLREVAHESRSGQSPMYSFRSRKQHKFDILIRLLEY